jgi:RNA polymerase sigma-70 factor (family 1)
VNLFSNYTDEELLSLIKRDDKEAFDALFNKYSRKVSSFAFSKVNSEDVTQEIVQDIFTNIWEKRHSLNIASVPGYLFTAVKYEAINHIKKELTHRKHHKLYKAFVSIRSVQFNDLKDALEEGVAKLPAKTQLVFNLSRLEGKSIAEIALKLNLSEKAIKYHISRSLKELRLYLKEFLISIALFILTSISER